MTTKPDEAVIAARHLCEEARKVLSTLRKGPPIISRGPLVHNLRELRRQVKAQFLDPPRISLSQEVEYLSLDDESNRNDKKPQVTSLNEVNIDAVGNDASANDISHVTTESLSTTNSNAESEMVFVNKKKVQNQSSTSITDSSITDTVHATNSSGQYANTPQKQNHGEILQVGPFVQPFLDVVLDPRAAGPYTLVALRSLHRLLSRRSIKLISAGFKPRDNLTLDHLRFEADMEPLMRGILECRFEQTDTAADEAIEMAIADLLSLIVSLDVHRVMNADVLMEAFNTVFVTRNTFVHSPALCYHFEQVLDGMVRDLFSNFHVPSSDGTSSCALAAKLIIEFLVSQLLHTPMTMEEGYNSQSDILVSSSGNMEAYALHDATRILCLRLIQTCLRTGWSDEMQDDATQNDTNSISPQIEDSILKFVKDDLCLSLLIVGQGIWAYQDSSSGALPGLISMDVLSEICSTLSTMWSTPSLREVLTTQFETIFTGFYQRALSLLRRLPVPTDSATFHANQIFDAEVEIILESLVDILCLHNDTMAESSTKEGALELLFATYDCNMNRSDVAAGIIGELSRCCGDIVSSSEKIIDKVAGASRTNSSAGSVSSSSGASTPINHSSMKSLEGSLEPQLRAVPAHLKELCAEALLGILKTMFHGSKDRSINPSTESMSGEEKTNESAGQSLRLAKEKKILMREAVELFNKKSSIGFRFLVENGLISEPVTPRAIATFLRNGIVLGLDKRAVGEYLGNKGKSPVAGKSPPEWERDWFHKDVLSEYCSSFHFKNQSLLDGLRMFLAAFRLPGEAQQIDRILQNFAESCGLHCAESQNGSLQLFSTDPKKASDAAYLLSFSIIMLNTDLHNDNIRPDRKMKVNDFVKNNTDYGRDITDPDKKLPSEYLASIYERIKDEQIRTEGEGADGFMTFERWKDVLRQTSTDVTYDISDAIVARDLLLDLVQKPILSAVCGFWGVTLSGEAFERDNSRSGMLNVQGARFGMDLSHAMISGLYHLGQLHLFQDFFKHICQLTGLLGDYKTDAVDRTSSFVGSLERQSAVVVVMKVANEFGDFIGLMGWKCVLLILFELRDLKLLGGGTRSKHRSLIIESDPDLLRSDSRRDWEMRLVKQCYEITGGGGSGLTSAQSRKSSGFFGAMGRAFFGSENTETLPQMNITNNSEVSTTDDSEQYISSEHGKEELVMWDDLAPSDEEDEFDPDEDEQQYFTAQSTSLGYEFEIQLIQEDQNTHQPGPPVTGLETYEDTRVYQLSPRARVRKRLLKLCDFSMILSETRFLDLDGIKALLEALIQIIDGDFSASQGSSPPIDLVTSISPGSEALAEVMIAEIALKNRDRVAALWNPCLKPHYEMRLNRKEEGTPVERTSFMQIPGAEKCVSGLLRICYHTVHRDDVNNEVLQTLKLLCPSQGYDSSYSSSLNFDKHIAEGLWRICRDVDGLLLVGKEGWDGILSLIAHCSTKGQELPTLNTSMANNLSDDDPALQAFRCMHLILHSPELSDVVPFTVIHSVRVLINGGERQNCPKLSLAGLDLLQLLYTRLHSLAKKVELEKLGETIWSACWHPLLEGMADASDSRYATTRQHSIAMFRDSLVDKNSDDIPIDELFRILNGVCMPMVSQRFRELVQHQMTLNFDHEEITIELELCISAVFKPFLRHLNKLSEYPSHLGPVWMSLISVVTQLVGKESTLSGATEKKVVPDHLLRATRDLVSERLRNVVMILKSKEILRCDNLDKTAETKDFSSMTWNALSNITSFKHLIPEWKGQIV